MTDVHDEIQSLIAAYAMGAVPEDEIPAMVDNLRFFAGAGRCLEGRASGEYTEGYTSIIRREPLGIVAGITPWNYPLMMAIWKLGPALAAGNVQILKPAEQTPLTTLRFAQLAAGILPPGVLNVITGDGEPVGWLSYDICRDPRWGRTEEAYGEDPYLVARMGTAFVEGLQGADMSQGVVATAKHFVGYSASEGGLNWAPPHLPDRRQTVTGSVKPSTTSPSRASKASTSAPVRSRRRAVAGFLRRRRPFGGLGRPALGRRSGQGLPLRALPGAASRRAAVAACDAMGPQLA